jgi:phenylacetate-CoA ligase
MHAGATNVYQQFAATLAHTEWQPSDKLARYRDGLLKRLVIFASTQSPFYRERLKPLFRNGPDPNLAAWSEIPVLRRAQLDTEIDRINAIEVPAEVGEVSIMRTSGTTGGRLTFRTCMLARIAAECMMFRHYCWHDLDFAAPMASVRFYSSGKRSYPDGITDQCWSAVSPGGAHHTLDVREPVEHVIAWLARRAPKYLLTFPSMMNDLAHHPDAAQVADLKLGKIIGISETLTPYVRDTVRQRFGYEIAQIYACGEMGCIALQSPADDHYLACEETVFLEILDEAGDPAKPGQPGRVVLTSLYNYATPFIRYEIGDFATLADRPCPSGRELKRLKRIEGRPSTSLRAMNGRRIWPHEIPISELAAQLSSERFQIRQPDKATIEVIYAGRIKAQPADEKQLDTMFERLLGGGISVRASPVDELPRTSGGKRELVTSMALS